VKENGSTLARVNSFRPGVQARPVVEEERERLRCPLPAVVANRPVVDDLGDEPHLVGEVAARHVDVAPHLGPDGVDVGT
jgi:hypothetical protein